MITLHQKQQIILLGIQGGSFRSIARQLRLNKETVGKYIRQYEAQRSQIDSGAITAPFTEKPAYNTSKRCPRPSTIEATKVIEQCLRENEEKRATGRRKQQMKKIDIHAYLVKQGHHISYSTVKRIVAKLEQSHQEAYIKQEYEPGDACEFDWGEATLDIGGSGYKKYQLAVFTPSYSNHRFAMLYFRQDTAAFQDSHAEYFAFAGGSFHTMVYDNMRVAVAKFVGPSEKEPTEALLRLSLHYGFAFRFCNPESGNEKGHVERSVEFIRRKAFSEPGLDRFPTLEAANAHLQAICNSLNTSPISDGTIPADGFREEQTRLLPAVPRFEAFRTASCHVDKYSTICADRNHYSVPDTLVGRRLDVRLYTDKILVFSKGELIATHPRSYARGQWFLDIFHYLRTLQRKPGALPHSTALLQSDPRLLHLFHSHYPSDPKAFLALLQEKGPRITEELQEDDENNHS